MKLVKYGGILMISFLKMGESIVGEMDKSRLWLGKMNMFSYAGSSIAEREVSIS